MSIVIDKEISLHAAMERFGTIVYDEGVKYMYFPYWVEEMEEDVFQLHKLDNLPENIKSKIEFFRDGLDESVKETYYPVNESEVRI